MDLLAWVLLLSTLLYVGAAVAFTVGISRIRAGSGKHQPFVSVVVAARNEEAYIGNCLQGLARQTYPKDRYEILVVNDASEDRTSDIVAGMAATCPHIRLLKVGCEFPHLAAKKRPMSLGIREARGEIILTTDADCRVPETWIAGVVACFEPNVGMVIGFSQVKSAGCPLTVFERLQAFDFLALMAAAAGGAGCGLPLAASGQNLAYRKACFDRVGGFRKIGHRPSGDDVLLLQLMRRECRQQIVFSASPGTYVSTWRTETPGGFWQQRRRWASNAAYQFWLNRPFFVYIVAVFLVNLLAPFGLIAGTMPGGRVLPLVCGCAKCLADLALTWKGASVFGRADLMPVLPAWEMLQAPYTVLIGIAGSVSGFTWKERRHG